MVITKMSFRCCLWYCNERSPRYVNDVRIFAYSYCVINIWRMHIEVTNVVNTLFAFIRKGKTNLRAKGKKRP